jgi:histidinol-phosphate aminotransferase
MTVSRRQFLSRTSLSAAAIPTLMSGGIGTALAGAASQTGIDTSMGFPEGALRMGFNENVLGPSPKAIAAATAAVPGSYRYALSSLLRPVLAKQHGIDPEWVLPGNGSTEVLALSPVAFVRNGGNVVTSHETWDGMISVADNLGVNVKRIKLLADKGYAYDVDGMLKAIDNDTKLVMVISPNNPTGSTMDYDHLKKLADALPKGALLVIDHAYADYLPAGKTGIDLLHEGYKNVLVTRTFSKAHALAGLRCGYGIAHPDILKEIRKFGCDLGCINMAVFAAVQGSLLDPGHIDKSRTYVAAVRKYYEQQTQQLGLEMVAGPAPFALINVGRARGKAVQAEMRKQKIFINAGDGWHLPDFIRVSYGREAENRQFFAALARIMKEARPS